MIRYTRLIILLTSAVSVESPTSRLWRPTHVNVCICRVLRGALCLLEGVGARGAGLGLGLGLDCSLLNLN